MSSSPLRMRLRRAIAAVVPILVVAGAVIWLFPLPGERADRAGLESLNLQSEDRSGTHGTLTSEARPQGLAGPRWPRTLSPGGRTQESAQPTIPGFDSEVRDPAIRLDSEIRGVVVDDRGAPVPTAQVHLMAGLEEGSK